jgi:6,7-dimethyl-8-ribityllumazine synthase
MSTAIQPRPRTVHGKRQFTIVASLFNAEYVQGLVNHATEELRVLAPSAVIALVQVPGAFEIPIVVRELAAEKKDNAIIAVGVILKGKTTHAENLSRSVTDALQRIATEHGVPIINAVLSLNHEIEARERCLEKKINRGIEAARAAVEIANVMMDLREKKKEYG